MPSSVSGVTSSPNAMNSEGLPVNIAVDSAATLPTLTEKQPEGSTVTAVCVSSNTIVPAAVASKRRRRRSEGLVNDASQPLKAIVSEVSAASADKESVVVRNNATDKRLLDFMV